MLSWFKLYTDLTKVSYLRHKLFYSKAFDFDFRPYVNIQNTDLEINMNFNINVNANNIIINTNISISVNTNIYIKNSCMFHSII